MKKAKKETAEVKQNQVLFANFKETLNNVRKFMTISDRIYKTLNTSRKEMILKEIDNLHKIASEF